MGTSMLYRLFGIGAIPEKIRPLLEAETIIVADEGVGGSFSAPSVTAPGRRYRHRREGFCGFLAVTGKRIVCYTYGRPQIDVSADDPRIAQLHVDTPRKNTLAISFESSAFRQGWSGIIEFRFATEKACAFYDALTLLGARQAPAGLTGTSGTPAGTDG